MTISFDTRNLNPLVTSLVYDQIKPYLKTEKERHNSKHEIADKNRKNFILHTCTTLFPFQISRNTILKQIFSGNGTK